MFLADYFSVTCVVSCPSHQQQPCQAVSPALSPIPPLANPCSPPVRHGDRHLGLQIFPVICDGMRIADCGGMSAAVSVITISGKPLGIAAAQASGLVGLEAYDVQVEVCCTR